MAKKKAKKEPSAKDYLVTPFVKGLEGFFTDYVVVKIERLISYARHKISNTILFIMSFFFAIIFIFLSIVFLAERYLNVHYGWSFLFIGLLLLILAIFFSNSMKEERLGG